MNHRFNHISHADLRACLIREARDFVCEARKLGIMVTVGMLVEALYDDISHLNSHLDGPDLHRLVVQVLCDVADWARLQST